MHDTQDDPQTNRHILILSSVALALYGLAMGLVFMVAV